MKWWIQNHLLTIIRVEYTWPEPGQFIKVWIDSICFMFKLNYRLILSSTCWAQHTREDGHTHLQESGQDVYSGLPWPPCGTDVFSHLALLWAELRRFRCLFPEFVLRINIWSLKPERMRLRSDWWLRTLNSKTLLLGLSHAHVWTLFSLQSASLKCVFWFNGGLLSMMEKSGLSLHFVKM